MFWLPEGSPADVTSGRAVGCNDYDHISMKHRGFLEDLRTGIDVDELEFWVCTRLKVRSEGHPKNSALCPVLQTLTTSVSPHHQLLEASSEHRCRLAHRLTYTSAVSWKSSFEIPERDSLEMYRHCNTKGKISNLCWCTHHDMAALRSDRATNVKRALEYLVPFFCITEAV